MNRSERRQMKKHEKKYGEKQSHQNFERYAKEILHKIDSDLELNDEENVFFSMIFEVYYYKKKPKSLIKSCIVSKMKFKEKKQNEIIMKNKWVENLVDVCFESINNIIEENEQLRQKIIDYWRKLYYSEEEIYQLYKNMKENNYKELPDFETLKKELFSTENILDIDINKKLLLEERDILTKYCIEVRYSATETVKEHIERKLSKLENRATLLKNVLENLHDIDTLLSDLKEYALNPKEKNYVPTIAINDMLVYMDDSNKFKDCPNYVLFLKELINSKHTTIEELLRIRESDILKYHDKYNNPTILDVNNINSPLEQIKKIKYRHEAEKR